MSLTMKLQMQDTISAIKEVEELKKNPNKKAYASFRELLEDITNE